MILFVAGRSAGGSRDRVPGVSEAAVGKHIGSVFTKPDLPPAYGTRRRVPAVLACLRA